MIRFSDILDNECIINIMSEERAFYAGKTVLVTGGGGSVGSELVRQLASFECKKIIIFEICENSAFELACELSELYPKMSILVEIGSVRDKNRLDELFSKHHPEIVFHAAAHKHVSLMENNPAEAVKNNCIGTLNCVEIAEKYGTEKFVLVSTDKAVNPTGVMGATKRVCEMVVLATREHYSKTSFAAVRFGNVFASNGSVARIFERQILKGGPVTVTDKRVTRYFMSVSNAATLLICAGAMAKNGELYVLDMGKPVKIYDIATQMIKKMGFVPGKEIKIVETGLRKGEKLYEEYLLENKTHKKARNDRIYVENNESFSANTISHIKHLLNDALGEYEKIHDNNIIKNTLREIVPEYTEC